MNNYNSDELFEIVPDKPIELEEDADIKVSKAASEENPVAEASLGDREETAAAEGPLSDREETSVAEDLQTTGEGASQKAEEEIKASGEEVSPTEDESDDFSAELAALEEEEDDRELMEAIGDSLSREMDAELGLDTIPSTVAINTGEDEDLQPDGEETSDKDSSKPWYKRIPAWCYASAASVLVLIIALICFLTSSWGKSMLIHTGSGYVADKVTFVPLEQVKPQEPTVVDEELNHSGQPVILPDKQLPADKQENPAQTETSEDLLPPVFTARDYNILLIGEEKIESGGYRGRSDLIAILTISNDGRPLKLTSILRDILVDIPGHTENRINASFAMGGVQLLYDTIRQNLGIEIDNYVLMDFAAFEAVIDELGGVELELTEKEAKYLNTTNFISKKADRKVVEGKNLFNGGQALGYVRMSKVWTANGLYNDMGRTSRQRYLMGQVYSGFAGASYLRLLAIADECLQYITTDIDRTTMETYLTILSEMDAEQGVEELTIPVAGTYHDAYVRGMLVTTIDRQANSEAFKNFVGR